MADFVLGRLKFNWRGNWSVSTAYIKDDIIKYGANTYTCLVNHTSSASTPGFYTDLNSNSYWSLHSEGLAFAGNWSASTFYKLNDLVKFGAYQYRCILQYTSGGSFAIGSNWEIYSEGLQFEDTYNAGTTYQDGDVVNYGGYTYVYINSTPASGQTPTDNAYWDILTTGFKMQGVYSSATAYKTGDVVKYGGNTYVFDVNTTAGQLPTNQAFADLLVEGISLQGAWSSATSYKIGEVVIYENSSYRAIQDNSNAIPSSSAANWALYNQGDPSGVLTTRGDLITRDNIGAVRFPIGRKGSVLVSDGNDILWNESSNSTNIIYVSPQGNDTTGDGSEFLPFKTIKKASQQTNKGGISTINTLSGGTGGTPGVYRGVSGTGGSGSGATFEVTKDGSSTASVVIMNQGSNFAVGNTITVSSGVLGGGTNLTFNVASVTAGDLIRVKNGVYFETFPIKLTASTTLEGDSLRNTIVRPAAGNSTQVATVNNIGANNGSRTVGTYLNCISTTSGSGTGAKFTVAVDGSTPIAVTCTHGGVDYQTGDTITIADNQLGSGGAPALTMTVATLKANLSAEMFLVNDAVNVRQFTFAGLIGGRVFSLDPSGSISTASPYIQNCSSINTTTTGMYIDGLSQTTGIKSMIANDYTQINNDGVGVHVLRGGRAELVSIFTYFCDKGFYAESGGFIRGLNCSMAYGEEGAVAEGTLASETPVTVQARGLQLYFIGNPSGGAVPLNGDTLVGGTSGATAVVRNFQQSPKILYIENLTGNFRQNETVTATRAGGITYTFVTSSAQGTQNIAQIGQKGTLFLLDSSDGTLSTANKVRVGSNIQFTGDNNVYAITAVTDEVTANQQVTVRINPEKTTSVADNANITIRTKFSNIRLTGHDFLDIGTGDIVTTNYPDNPSQPADQASEVVQTNGGRVYFTSTDQRGDFRVGDLFRIEQSTGVATLNADAFDLSGLTQLQLGSIGAQIGATINEFSTDGTLAGNSDIAVPTEQAVKTYVDTNSFSTGKAIAMAIVFG
jgi:hypothetical protein